MYLRKKTPKRIQNRDLLIANAVDWAIKNAHRENRIVTAKDVVSYALSDFNLTLTTIEAELALFQRWQQEDK